MKSKQDVIDWLDDNRSHYADMADAIWERPEIAYREFYASELQASFLEAEGFRVERDIAGSNTALVAEWGSGTPIIGFAGEYDALPGLSQKRQPTPEPLVEGGPGHGCGHNLLGTAHVASVVALKRWMAANMVAGTVRYYGCPAEEAGAAKTFMARAGLFDDLDAAFNFHPMHANMPMKGSTAGVNTVKFQFRGQAAHAGASPHLGRSALDGVELLNVGLNYLREHVTPDVRMHYTITNGGSAPNIVPAEAEGLYIIRAHQPDNLREVTDRVRRIAEGAALMTGTSVSEVFVDAMSSVLNNAYLADLHYENMKVVGPIRWTDEEIGFAGRIREGYPVGTARANLVASSLSEELALEVLLGDNYPPMDEGKVQTWSTDVGDLSWKAPLSMLMTACFSPASPIHSWGAVAAAGTSIGHKGMMHAAKIMALTAMDLYTESEHLKRTRAEFERKLQANPYVNPIPEGISPPRYSPRG